MLVIIQEILYPLLCHSDDDDDLFENDPIEYIKIKYGNFKLKFTNEFMDGISNSFKHFRCI